MAAFSDRVLPQRVRFSQGMVNVATHPLLRMQVLRVHDLDLYASFMA
jgi:hypothetical protein